MAERVMIFIDGSNLYHSLKTHFGRTDLDMGKFCNKMLGRRQLTRIYYYNARVGQKEEPERYKHQQAFFTSVKAIPYIELRIARLVYNNWPSTPPYEKGTDVQLATDMLTHAFKSNYDTAILVAGDNDYVSAVQAVKDYGKHFEIALFGKEGTSRQLRDTADKVIPMNRSLLKGCWKQLERRPFTPRGNEPRANPSSQNAPGNVPGNQTFPNNQNNQGYQNNHYSQGYQNNQDIQGYQDNQENDIQQE